MEYIDAHAHMISRTADDYEAMALTGCIAVCEPAFEHAWHRQSIGGFLDYFRRLTDAEPRRAARFGIRHFAWLCLSPRRAEDRELALAIVARIPRFLERPNVLGIGETGLYRGTRNELETFRDHVDLAIDHDQLLLVRTPQLEAKLRGTRLIVETLASDGRVIPERVLIDHVEEHTIGMVLQQGFWAGITLHPHATASPQRAIDMIERFGPDRICVASGCDGGPSTATAVAHFALAMRRRGHPDTLIRRIVYENPAAFLGQSPRFQIGHPPDRKPRRRPADRHDEASEPVAAGHGG
jgi:hypothetical protein